jgi:hypothetical protein
MQLGFSSYYLSTAMNQLSQRFQVASDGRTMKRCLLATSILPNVILRVYLGSGSN